MKSLKIYPRAIIFKFFTEKFVIAKIKGFPIDLCKQARSKTRTSSLSWQRDRRAVFFLLSLSLSLFVLAYLKRVDDDDDDEDEDEEWC